MSAVRAVKPREIHRHRAARLVVEALLALSPVLFVAILATAIQPTPKSASSSSTPTEATSSQDDMDALLFVGILAALAAGATAAYVHEVERFCKAHPHFHPRVIGRGGGMYPAP